VGDRRSRPVSGSGYHLSPREDPQLSHAMITDLFADSPQHEDTDPAQRVPGASRERNVERAATYVPRILQQHLIDDPAGRCWTADGTTALLDISGFTTLSERLARKGREGAEQITEAIGRSFESILQVAYESGGSLLKFGGDALLLWFEGNGHAARACRATVLMRRMLRDVGRIEVPGANVTLRISQGVHSGCFHFFAAGTSHVELLPTGAGWSRAVAMEREARAGEIVVSPETAALLPNRCLGTPKAPGVLLLREPAGHAEKLPLIPRPNMAPETLLRCLSPAIRAHVLGGGGASEHRPVTIAFIRFEGTDALIEQHDPSVVGDALHRLVSVVEAATEGQEVSFLGSDVDADGGKLILTAGAPRATGDDEERMLLALRKIVETDLAIPIRIGVHRGSVFAGDIGPAYRRTYTVMGDAVNLSARLMAEARPGLIYATADVLDRSNTLFEATELTPFAVKGKAKPVQAWSVGKAKGSRRRNLALQRLPLVGREAELGIIREALASARAGTGRLIDVVGEPGIGKTRLLEALRDEATGFHRQHAVCEAYNASTPYAVWRELHREFIGIGREESDGAVVERLRDAVATHVPDLAPWLPLIAIPFGVEVPPTPEVEMLAEKNRRTKLHEAVGRFLVAMMPDPQLIEIEDAHHMDAASAELFSYLTRELAARPWLFAAARRPAASGFTAPESPAVMRIELKPLTPNDSVKLIQLATEQQPLLMHVVEVVAQRSGGNPQFLRDLARSAADTGGIGGLPDSAEAAAMARIDALAPEDRALVRRAAVFGQTFHPRMLSWLADEGDGALPDPATWARLGDFFAQEPDGYLRFRRSLLRDAAYEGLPYKLRRRLHGAAAARIEEESDDVEEAAGILSLHYFVAGDNRSAWRYATVAGKRADGVYAYVEAARLYARALEAGRRLEDVGARELAAVYRALGDAWYRAGEFQKSSEAYVAARGLVASDPLMDAELLLKLSHIEEKLGKYERALRWTEKARTAIQRLQGPEAARQVARSGAWYAMLLQGEGRTRDALEWAERTVPEAEAADDPEALADAYFVMGWAYGELGKEEGLTYMQRSLEAYRRSGNLARQADVLLSLGAVCQWAGRWDEALSYYERGRDEALKIGDTVGAAVARINVAEILSDRGEWAEAEALLLETLPLWKASQYRYYLAGCLWYLGRVTLRLGRFEEALNRLDESKSNFLTVGAEEQVPAVDARIAECRVAMGNSDAALELVRGMLGRASGSNGVARVVPLLERVRAHALLRQGDLRGARDALRASLAAARGRHDLFEVTLTLLSLIALDRLEGVEPPLEMVDESRSLLGSLKISAVPPVPLPAR
jgi:class 3 adenylate cyclase/tetratricopeptide (TPR) repeat protein